MNEISAFFGSIPTGIAGYLALAVVVALLFERRHKKPNEIQLSLLEKYETRLKDTENALDNQRKAHTAQQSDMDACLQRLTDTLANLTQEYHAKDTALHEALIKVQALKLDLDNARVALEKARATEVECQRRMNELEEKYQSRMASLESRYEKRITELELEIHLLRGELSEPFEDWK